MVQRPQLSYRNKKTCREGILCILIIFLLIATSVTVIATENTIRIGIEEYDKITYVDDDGIVKGFNVDIIEYIAEEEGWEIEYVPSTWSKCLENLESGEIDLIIMMAYSEERDEIYDFTTEPFFSDWAQVFVRTDTDIRSITDLEGKAVVGVKNDQVTNWFKEHAGHYELEYELIEANSITSSLEFIDNGTATAIVISQISGNAAAKEYGIEGAPIESSPMTLHAATLEGHNEEILLIIGKHLKVMKGDESSFYYTTYDKWFPPPTTEIIPKEVLIVAVSISALALVFLIVNLTLRKKVQRKTHEIEQAEAKYSVIVEEGTDSIIIIQNYLIEFANPKFAEMLGYKKEEVTRKPFTKCLSESVRNEDTKRYEDLIIGHSSLEQQYETVFVSKNGRDIPIEISSSLIHYRGKKAVMSVIRDITSRKQYEKDLLDAKLNAEVASNSKSAFLANMSHDLITPLNAIMGYSELLLTEDVGHLNGKQAKYTGNILKSGKILLNVINDVLDISKVEAGKMKLRSKESSIQGILSGVDELIRAEHPEINNRIIYNIDDSIRTINADDIKLKNILLNLIDNAIKHSPENEKIYVDIISDNENLQFSVKNRGKGIPEEMQEHIFKPFFQIEKFSSKEKGGTGLGLAIAEHYIKLHNGKIWIESVMGEDTSFIFTIPKEQEPAEVITPNHDKKSDEQSTETKESDAI